jgi:hypothetical protein
LDDSVGGVGAGASGVFRGRDTEENHRGDANVGEDPDLFAEALEAVLDHAGHGVDRFGFAEAFLHEERSDEVIDAHPGFGDQAPQRRGAAQPARSLLGESHDPIVGPRW